MAEIASDRELLARLGLTEAQAADFLDRSRQAVNAALSAESGGRKRYFRAADVLVLRLAARQLGTHVDDEAILDYVRHHHGARAAERVRTAFGALATPPDFSGAKELWVVVPDVIALRQESPEHAEFLKQLPVAHPGVGVRYFSTSSIQENVLRVMVLGPDKTKWEGATAQFTSDSMIGAQPPMLIANPLEAEPETFVLMPPGFVRAPLIKGGLVAGYLLSLIKTLPVAAPADDAVAAKKAAG